MIHILLTVEVVGRRSLEVEGARNQATFSRINVKAQIICRKGESHFIRRRPEIGEEARIDLFDCVS